MSSESIWSAISSLIGAAQGLEPKAANTQHYLHPPLTSAVSGEITSFPSAIQLPERKSCTAEALVLLNFTLSTFAVELPAPWQKCKLCHASSEPQTVSLLSQRKMGLEQALWAYSKLLVVDCQLESGSFPSLLARLRRSHLHCSELGFPVPQGICENGNRNRGPGTCSAAHPSHSLWTWACKQRNSEHCSKTAPLKHL